MVIRLGKKKGLRLVKPSLRLVGQPTTTSDDIIRLGTTKKQKKQKKRSQIEKGLIAQTAILTGATIAGVTLLAAPALPFLAIGAGLASAISTASLLGAIRERPDIAGKIITGEGGAFLATLPETIGQAGKDIKEKITGLTTPQKIAVGAGTAALVGGGIVAGRKIREIIRERSIERIQIPAAPSLVAPSFFQVEPEAMAPIISKPISAFEPAVEEEKVKEVPMITNKINVSPEINIKFSKSRKFINQQILV